MHVVVGACIVAGAFLLSLDFMDRSFTGYWNVYALILLLGVPTGLAVASHRFESYRATFRALRAALTRPLDRERQALLDALVSLGREVRAGHGRNAYELIEASPDLMFKLTARHLLQHIPPEEIEADALALGRRELDEYRAAERLFSTVGNAAPAVGMTGTVIGLIQLLIHLEDFSALGSGMAIALLTTLYGLVLGHVIFLPLSRLMAEFGQGRAETMQLVTNGMLKLARQRPVHELEQVLERPQRSSESGLAGASA